MIRELGEIRQIRKKYGISQIELAKLAGVSQSLIAKIEGKRIDPTYTKTKKIFDALENLNKQKELKAKDIMNVKVISIKPSDSIKEAISKMKRYEISQMPVVENNKLVGVVSEAIILDALSNGKDVENVREIMEDCPPLISENSSASAVSGLLKYFPIVLVSQKGKLKGVITKADMLMKVYK